MDTNQHKLDHYAKNTMMHRLANKSKENSAKPPIISPDVVQTADFSFSQFRLPEQAGDSGQLLIAKSKADPMLRYIVKHEYTDCACNDYIYTKLAQAMGYHMPDAVLFQISRGEKQKRFKTEYIIGERFLNIVNPAPGFAEIHEKATNWPEYFAFFALFAITAEADGLELPLADDGLIYRVDTTAAFPIDNSILDFLGIDITVNGYSSQVVVQDYLNAQQFVGTVDFACCNRTLEACQREYAECMPYFLEPFYRIQDIRDDYIDGFLNTLCYFYPDCLGDFYKRYIHALQKQSAQYLASRR